MRLANSGSLCCKINLGDLQIQHRLTFGLVLGFDNLTGFIFAAGAQAGAFASGGVHAIILSTANAATS
jgi:hypothetical protein